MCSVIEIKTPSEYTIRYETEDALGTQRVQRTKNVKLITIESSSLDETDELVPKTVPNTESQSGNNSVPNSVSHSVSKSVSQSVPQIISHYMPLTVSQSSQQSVPYNEQHKLNKSLKMNLKTQSERKLFSERLKTPF